MTSVLIQHLIFYNLRRPSSEWRLGSCADLEDGDQSSAFIGEETDAQRWIRFAQLYIEYEIQLYLIPRFPESFPPTVIYILSTYSICRGKKPFRYITVFLKKASIPTFITVLCTIAKSRKQHMCPYV